MKMGAIVDFSSGAVLVGWCAEGDHTTDATRKFVELPDPAPAGKRLDVSVWPNAVVWVDDLEGLRADLLTRLERERIRREAAGIEFQGKVYSSDAASLQRMAAVESYATRHGVLPSDPFYWSGTEMDLLTFQAFQDAKVEQGAGVYAAYLAHKAAIQALSSRQAVEGYDLSAGWA